jgi:hypothetical protein
MSPDAILGCALLAGALGFLIVVTLWSRRTINWIAMQGRTSTRDMVKKLNGR